MQPQLWIKTDYDEYRAGVPAKRHPHLIRSVFRVAVIVTRYTGGGRVRASNKLFYFPQQIKRQDRFYNYLHISTEHSLLLDDAVRMTADKYELHAF